MASLRLAGGLEHVRGLGGGVLQRRKAGALRVGRMQLCVDFSRWPGGHAGLRGAAVSGKRAVVFRGFGPPLILTKRIQPSFLVVGQEAKEFLQRRLNGVDRRYQRLDPRLHGGEPGRSG